MYQSSPSGIKQEPNHNVDGTQPVHLTRRAKHEQRFQRLNLSGSSHYISTPQPSFIQSSREKRY